MITTAFNHEDTKHTKSELQSQDNPAHPLLEDGHVEVHNESDSILGSSQVADYLRDVNRVYLLYGFQLQNKPLINEQVESVMAEQGVPILDRNELFDLIRNLPSTQFKAHSAPINAFEPTRPKLHMNVEARIDRLADQVLEIGR